MPRGCDGGSRRDGLGAQFRTGIDKESPRYGMTWHGTIFLIYGHLGIARVDLGESGRQERFCMVGIPCDYLKRV